MTGMEGHFTGIASDADSDSFGNAGMVDVTVDGLLELTGGAKISSSTWAKGNAGSVMVLAGELWIAGMEDQISAIESDANPGSDGNAGSVEVIVDGPLELVNGAMISSSTWARGNGGSVTIQAENIRIEDRKNRFAGILSTAGPDSFGNAGSIDITIDELLEMINGAMISSTACSSGDAGSVSVQADRIRIDDQGRINQLTGILSNTTKESRGNAGSVDITVDGLLELDDGAEISSSTNGQGEGGNVRIQAGGINSPALPASQTPDHSVMWAMSI